MAGRRVLLGFLAVVLVGCSTASGPPAGNVVLAAALQPFGECEELRDYFVRHALEVVGPYGLDGGFGDDVAVPEAADARAEESGVAQASDGGAQAGRDFSATNVAEAGVDEPDIVKTDGRLLLAVAQQRLWVLDVTGEQPRRLGSLALDDTWGHELLLDGDRALVLATGDGGGAVPLAGDIAIAPAGGLITTLTAVDLSQPAEPRVVERLVLDGAYRSARMVEGVARVVLHSQPNGLDFTYPEGGGLRAERAATERNREVVESSTVDNWLPYYVLEDGDGRVVQEGAALRCEAVRRPAEFSGLGVLSVLSIDLDQGLVPRDSGTGVVADGETVYASTENLYVATQRWSVRPWQEPRGDAVTTELHRFDITDPAAAAYVASGSVSGYLLNQFSLSEHDGALRVATTEGEPWADASESFVRVLRERDGALAEVGAVGGLGKGERIYSVRFMGDVGYVVTFRETDPLYAVDLSDETAPRVTGELKIPGYSAYLHPVGEGRLLGVGQDAAADGRTLGSQVSLFDVSDPAQPRRLDQITLGEGYSDVEHDHRAFLYWPQTGLAMMPVQQWSFDEKAGTEDVSAYAFGFTVGSSRLHPVGEVTHVGESSPDPWQGQIRRALVMRDQVLTVSELGVKSSDLGTLGDVGWVEFSLR